MKIIDYIRDGVREYFKYLFIISPLLALVTWFASHRVDVNNSLDYMHGVLSGAHAYIGIMPNAVAILKVANWIFPVAECMAMIALLIPLRVITTLVRLFKATVPGWS